MEPNSGGLFLYLVAAVTSVSFPMTLAGTRGQEFWLRAECANGLLVGFEKANTYAVNTGLSHDETFVALDIQSVLFSPLQAHICLLKAMFSDRLFSSQNWLEASKKGISSLFLCIWMDCYVYVTERDKTKLVVFED